MTPQQKTLVRQALLHINLCEMSQYEAMPEVDHTFSERFENKMGKLIHRRQLAIYPLIKTPTRKCVALLVIVFLISSLSLSVSAIREPIFSAFERISEKFTEIIFPKKEQNSLTEYEVGWIPEKYRLVANTSGDIFTTREWIYENYYITLDQTLSGNIHYDTEDVTLQEVIWGYKTITYYQKYNAYLFSWSENGSFFTLTCPADLPLEDIRRMIESIHPAE